MGLAGTGGDVGIGVLLVGRASGANGGWAWTAGPVVAFCGPGGNMGLKGWVAPGTGTAVARR